MSADREEIRWKLGLLLDSFTNTMEYHEGERSKIEETYDKIERTITEARNNWLAGIAFGIGTWISLIAIGYAPKEQAWYIIIGMVIGFAIFIGTNTHMGKLFVKFRVLDDKYEQDMLDLMRLKGWLQGRSMREDVTLQQIVLLVIFFSVFTKVISYEMEHLGHRILKLEKPKKEDFQQWYESAKTNLNNFQILGLKEECKRIESFIKEFEVNDKHHETVKI
ncbi:MAG: hypothetical protein AUH25_01655 [Thaumarchaeota archaeon 13_1_40CM_38_12]|nr:MAG: hypothetical protein AUH25_01655 [Thaumarchaeota archaeon 13_1_40CM_38_12]OLC33612.1 MAG: hypothetical protein AUH84_06810 [Thaumarchaeota archaeon 13_1_40CM_4_38_7]OLC92660.1 MAG: hypothetical protein AUI92_04660 [Thaumarchaeota archaeon 13_1_40CM_3_38_6]OLD30273.1 MAG: hypothetical protein AUI62_01685 [Thaumarchaeota archaeon 13_1_40CM_2_39_7]